MSLVAGRIIPEGYSFDGTLIDILVERYTDIDIYWYHWPRDGMYTVEDFEPVIITYSNNHLCCVAVRSHWRFHSSLNSDQNIPIPVRIVFDPTQHSALVATNRISYKIVPHMGRLLQKNPITIKGSRISDMFRIGLKHPSNLLKRTFEDPAIYARTLLEDYCKNNLT